LLLITIFIAFIADVQEVCFQCQGIDQLSTSKIWFSELLHQQFHSLPSLCLYRQCVSRSIFISMTRSLSGLQQCWLRELVYWFCATHPWSQSVKLIGYTDVKIEESQKPPQKKIHPRISGIKRTSSRK
jgi:hypothetical protein